MFEFQKKYAHMETYSSAKEQHRQVVIFGPNAWSLAVDYTDKLSEVLGCEYADWYEYVTPNWLMYEPEVLSTNWNVRNWQLREVYLIPPLVFSMDLHDLEEWPLRTSKNRYSVINRNTFTLFKSTQIDVFQKSYLHVHNLNIKIQRHWKVLLTANNDLSCVFCKTKIHYGSSKQK